MPGGTRTYAELPDEAVAFLSSQEAFAFAQKFTKTYAIPAERTQDILTLLDDVALGIVALKDLPTELQKLGVAPDQAKTSSIELASERLLPIAGVIGDVGAQIRDWGGRLSEAQAEPKVVLPKQTAETFVDGFLGERRITMPSEVLQNRLKILLVSFVKGVRTEADAVAMMGRPIKVGGLEMPEADAKQLLKGVQDKLAFTKIEGEEPKMEEKKEIKELPVKAEELKVPPKPTPSSSAPKAQSSPVSPRSSSPKPTPPPLAGKAVDAFTDEDEKEAQGIAAKRNVAAAPTGSILEPKAIAAAVASEAKLTFATPELQKRFENIVDARTRDVRDAFETRSLLEAPAEKSGMGITGGMLASVVESLEKMIDERKKALDAFAEKERQRATAKVAEDRRTRDQAVQMKEERELAKRYGEITGVVDAGAVQAAVSGQPRPAPRVSPGTIPASGSRPKVEEIRFAQRLSGPVDELRMMTLTDFRRLSKDPAEAVRRVEGKVRVLEDLGYDQKIAAVKAWKESPLHRLYLSLSEEALAAGKTLPEAAEARKAAGGEAPTADELKAIATLNGELRF